MWACSVREKRDRHSGKRVHHSGEAVAARSRQGSLGRKAEFTP